MNIKCVFFCFWGLCFFVCPFWLGAQEDSAYDDDCGYGDSIAMLSARNVFLSDSLEWANFVPAKPRSTEPCAMPSVVYQDVAFTMQHDRIYGFFRAVENADFYLVVLDDGRLPLTAPVNGVSYKTGMRLGSGTIVYVGGATAFAALDIHPADHYRISIYAANTNCASGVHYNELPLFSGVLKPSGVTELNRYYGNLHSHSSYSDGNQDNTSLIPSDDYAFAKDALCMDFLGIAEHNHYSSPSNPGMHLADYAKGIQQADAFTANNPGFLALYGMEFGVISNGGHVVVYGIDSLLGWETLVGSPNYNIYVGKYDYSGTNGLFSVINRFRNKNAFGTFAHPDDTDYGNLLHVQYQPLADSAVVGSALENGPAFSDKTNYHDYPSNMSYLSYYRGMLAKGYHIGPVMDHDNHNLTFGRTTRSRLVVMSPSLTKDDFLASMRSMRFYASHSCTAALDFQVSGKDMGSSVEHGGAPAMVVTIADPSSTQQPVIRIYKGTSNGSLATVVATGNGSSFSYTDESLADGAAAYYYADISIGSQRTISSPVWYQRNDNPPVTAVPDVADDDASLTIYGNPVAGAMLRFKLAAYIYGQRTTAQVKDMYGRVILKSTVNERGEINSLNISGLPAGIYVLTVSSDKKEYRRKFMKY